MDILTQQGLDSRGRDPSAGTDVFIVTSHIDITLHACILLYNNAKFAGFSLQKKRGRLTRPEGEYFCSLENLLNMMILLSKCLLFPTDYILVSNEMLKYVLHVAMFWPGCEVVEMASIQVNRSSSFCSS